MQEHTPPKPQNELPQPLNGRIVPRPTAEELAKAIEEAKNKEQKRNPHLNQERIPGRKSFK